MVLMSEPFIALKDFKRTNNSSESSPLLSSWLMFWHFINLNSITKCFLQCVQVICTQLVSIVLMLTFSVSKLLGHILLIFSMGCINCLVYISQAPPFNHSFDFWAFYCTQLSNIGSASSPLFSARVLALFHWIIHSFFTMSSGYLPVRPALNSSSLCTDARLICL